MQLVIVDTARIQPYIFGSNRLRENAGASHLVARATTVWALETIKNLGDELGQPHNILDPRGLSLREQLDFAVGIKANGLFAEVIYAGGGNAAILFQEKAHAEMFIRALSCRVLAHAPGLQLIIAPKEFNWDTQALAVQVDEMFARHLAKEKRERAFSSPLLGQSVTVMCQSTGLPAVDFTRKIANDESSVYPASAEIHAKIAAADAANEHLLKLFDGQLRQSYDFPLDLDDLGRGKGEHSYIAVVHADGDGMGDRIRKLSADCRKPDAQGDCKRINERYVEKLRAFSHAVAEAARAALATSLDRLIGSIDANGEITHSAASAVAPVALKLEKYKYWLPFRPVVFGGDDVTFVCDGRLGLSLATLYAREFAAETAARPECGEDRITARNGVAIVKTHYPFARAYHLAEDLARQARDYRRELSQGRAGWDGTCLDWHFALSGLAGEIKEIRRREYTAAGNRLQLRPLTLDDNPMENARSWPVVTRLLQAFQEQEWSARRNKLKALRDALREGPEAVKQFRTQYGVSLPTMGAASAFEESGWVAWDGEDALCGYFDAIEAADWFMPL